MGAMLAKRAQRDSKHVRRQIMPTASVCMVPILFELPNTNTVISETLHYLLSARASSLLRQVSDNWSC